VEIPRVPHRWRVTPKQAVALLCDGQGIAHPRRFGLASHLGVLVGMPVVGCAKSRLCGSHGPLGAERGSVTPLLEDHERIGSVVRSRTAVRPVYVSPGHLIDHESSVRWTLACGAGYRVPEPIRLADRLAAEFKRTGCIEELQPRRTPRARL
jgi:deoxyribonuclease V